MPLPGRTPGQAVLYALVALALLMSSINLTIVAVALPAMTRSLDTTLAWVGWTLTGYQLMQIIVLPLAGRLSDSLGRKRVFLFCVATFSLGSLLCGLAPDVRWLIAFRLLQAIGGGGLMPSAVGIISDQFPERRSQLIGLFSSILPIGTVIGPNLGGWIVEHLSWREVFFVNVPIGLLVVLAAALLLRDRRPPAPFQRFDLPGLALFVAAMVAWMAALTWLGNDSNAWRAPLFWLLLLASAGLFWAFFRQERRAPNPIVDPGITLRRPFLPAHLYNFLFGAASFGVLSFVPLYAVTYYQLSPVLSGVVLTPRSLVVISVSALTSLLLPRLGYRLPMLSGMAFVFLGTLMLSFGWRQVEIGPLLLDGFWVLATQVAVAGVGIGLSTPAAHNASIDLAPHKAAAISGLRSMFRNIGGITTVSAIVLVLSLSEDRAAGLRLCYLVLACVMLSGIPLALMVPDLERREVRAGLRRAGHARGVQGDNSL